MPVKASKYNLMIAYSKDKSAVYDTNKKQTAMQIVKVNANVTLHTEVESTSKL